MHKHLHATLIEGDVGQQLKVMAIPMVWGLMSTMSLNAVETFFIARLGREALAAFSFTFPILMVLTSLGIGLGAGTSSAVARAIGEGDEMRARRLATDAMSLTFLLAVCVCIVGWLTIEPLFLAMGASPELIPLIRSYMSIWYFSPPCLLVPMVGLAALRAMGMSHVQGYIMSAAGIFNLLLDPILIFGWGPIPSLGLSGAAIATLLTRTLILVTVIYILHRKVGMLVNPFVRWGALRNSWATIVFVGVPAMCANIVIPIASVIVLAMVSAYGNDAVAGLGIAARVEPLMLIVFYALSGIIGPFFGQNSGAGKLERLDEAVTLLTRFCLLMGAVVAVFLWFGGAAIAGLFGDHREVVLVAASYFSIIPLSYGAYGIIMSVNAAFNGLGRPWPAMALSGARVLYVYLPLAWLGQWIWGLQGLFMATALANVSIALWAWWWIRRYIAALSPNNICIPD